MSQEPTKRQQTNAENYYKAACKFLHEHIEEICTDPIERHCAVKTISDTLAFFSRVNIINDEQHKFLVTALNECLEYEIHEFNEKE